MKSILLFFSFLFILAVTAQTPTYNFDFEEIDKAMPTGWKQFGSESYTAQVDGTHASSGKRSASIVFSGDSPDFAALAFTLPNNYKGKKITLSGYLKTENVEDGFAGLWMRIDPGIAFNNMREKGINGTTEWTKYEITLELQPEETKRIVIGALLTGKGKMWVDQLSVTIDGKEIQSLKPYQKQQSLADLDTTFNAGSRIDAIELNQALTTQLSNLGMIWGFLKYHHPTVARGERNWDYELFRILPQIISAPNSEACNTIYLEWIERLGTFKKGKKPKYKQDELKLAPDLEWIETSGFSNELIQQLQDIRYAKRPKEHYYIGFFPGVENPEFKHENPYSKMSYPDAGYRLLSLFRYWSIIHYYFPYKNLIEEDWKAVLNECIPKFVHANNQTEYELACLEIIARVHDTHANIWSSSATLNEYWGKNYANIEVTFVENKAVVTGYIDENLRQEGEPQIGDVIAHINNRTIEMIVNEQLHLTPASNYPTQLRNIARKLPRTNDSTLQLTIERNNVISEISIPAYPTSRIDFKSGNKADTSFRMINENIAYIDHGALQRSHLPTIWQEIKNTKGLIIDDRNYPSDFPIYELSKLLMPKKIPFVKFTTGNIQHPGFFTYGKTLFAGQNTANSYHGKVIILVNETSQSSAEFHAMAYRVHPNAVVIGSTTAGADGNISRFYLPGGIATLISGIGVYYPNGNETQRVGIIPDIECQPSVQGIREGRDEILEKAIETILK